MPPLSPETVAAITKSVADGFDAQIAYTQKLIRFGGQRGEEAGVMDWVFQEYENRGWKPVKIEMDESELGKHIGAGKFSPTHSHAPIVVGAHEPRGNAAGKSLILNGHIDVVPLGPTDMWSLDPYSGRIEGDKLYGRGQSSQASSSSSGWRGHVPSGSHMLRSGLTCRPGSGDMRAGAAANVWALDALRVSNEPGVICVIVQQAFVTC